MAADEARAEDESYPFDVAGFSLPVRHSGDALVQRWFDRGLMQAINFNHDEAVLCFSRAAAIDPTCAMAHWGIAYASGVNYNKAAFLDDAEAQRGFHASREALRLVNALGSSFSQDWEHLLCHALSHRFDGRPLAEYDDQRYADRNRAYATAMADVYETTKKNYGLRQSGTAPKDAASVAASVAALYAEALMQLRPWKLWCDISSNATGNTTASQTYDEETMEIQRVLEGALASWPHHPGLCHFYVHLMEMSPTPEKALRPACDVLRYEWPTFGHLVHMASHIDMQVGAYAAAIESNERGVRADLVYTELRGRETYYLGYLVHNYHMLCWAALFEGRYQCALDAARAIVTKTIPPAMLTTYGNFLEPYCAGKWHVWLRFGKWREILRERLPGDDGGGSIDEGSDGAAEGQREGFGRGGRSAGKPSEEKSVAPDCDFLVSHATALYAKAVALAVTGNTIEARAMQAKYRSASAVDGIEERVLHNVPSSRSFAIADNLLEGEILFREWSFAAASLRQMDCDGTVASEASRALASGLLDGALKALRKAVELDDGLPYDEPWGWMTPARHALSALLVEAADNSVVVSVDASGGKNWNAAVGREALLAEAEECYRRDLEMHPNNVWSLHGLLNCRSRIHGSSDPDRELLMLGQQAMEAAARADVPIGASCMCALDQQQQKCGGTSTEESEDEHGEDGSRLGRSSCCAGSPPPSSSNATTSSMTALATTLTRQSIFTSPAYASATSGVAQLQHLPRCATLMRYGGGDEMRQGEALLSLPLDAAAAVPPSLKVAIVQAVEAAIARRNAGLFEASAADYVSDKAFPKESAGVVWDAALAVSTAPTSPASNGEDSCWANVWFHGWLYSKAVEEANSRGADCKLGSEADAVQRYPLVGIFADSTSAGASTLSSPSAGGFAPFQGTDACFRSADDASDTRAAGWGGALQPVDQHLHKVDPHAGGSREDTIELYVSEMGMSREDAVAVVAASEIESDQYHLGSDCARVDVSSIAVDSAGDQVSPAELTHTTPSPCCIAWAVAVDLPSALSETPSATGTEDRIVRVGTTPRVHASLLLALPKKSEAAAWFRRWNIPSDAATARAMLHQQLVDCPGLPSKVASSISAVLQPKVP